MSPASALTIVAGAFLMLVALATVNSIARFLVNRKYKRIESRGGIPSQRLQTIRWNLIDLQELISMNIAGVSMVLAFCLLIFVLEWLGIATVKTG